MNPMVDSFSDAVLEGGNQLILCCANCSLAMSKTSVETGETTTLINKGSEGMVSRQKKMVACAGLSVMLIVAASVCITLQAARLVYMPEQITVDKPGLVASHPVQVFTKEELRSNFTQDTHTYLFVADGKKKPYSYINDMGVLTGFDVDLVEGVCSLVGKKCVTILAPFTDCIFTYKDIDYAGTGLWSQWFDGCPGYDISTDRRTEFDFTLPYIDSVATFTVAPGNPSGFNPDDDDYSEFTLLRLSGAPTNGPCLTRLKKTYGKFLVAANLPEAKELLLNGTADVLFSPRTKIDGLETLTNEYRCSETGAGIMMRKGSNLSDWWNPAFQTFYFSGEYQKMCDNSLQKYGAQVRCMPGPDDASSEHLAMMKATPVQQGSNRLWKFVVSGKIAPYSFLDDDGNLVGWTKDFIAEVCQRAGKQCHLMLAKVSECTTRDGELLYPGRGLSEGWFDACTGYFQTPERSNSWDFTMPYLVSNASFYVRAGNPRKFDPTMSDYSSYTLVRADTAITTDHCLNRLGKKFGTLLVVPTQYEAIDAVLNGTADAWFTKRKGVTSLEELPQRFHCENVGTSIMTKKGSELPGWWNQAFQEFFMSGGFTQFCEEKGQQYSFDFPCVPLPPLPS